MIPREEARGARARRERSMRNACASSTLLLSPRASRVAAAAGRACHLGARSAGCRCRASRTVISYYVRPRRDRLAHALWDFRSTVWPAPPRRRTSFAHGRRPFAQGRRWLRLLSDIVRAVERLLRCERDRRGREHPLVARLRCAWFVRSWSWASHLRRVRRCCSSGVHARAS